MTLKRGWTLISTRIDRDFLTLTADASNRIIALCVQTKDVNGQGTKLRVVKLYMQDHLQGTALIHSRQKKES